MATLYTLALYYYCDGLNKCQETVYVCFQLLQRSVPAEVPVVYGEESTSFNFNNLWLHCSISGALLANPCMPHDAPPPHTMPLHPTQCPSTPHNAPPPHTMPLHQPQAKTNHTSGNCCFVKCSLHSDDIIIIIRTCPQLHLGLV